MTNLEVFLLIAVLLILIGGGVILYLALAGLAIIYSMGANESPRGRRIFFGVLGVVMIVAFVCAPFICTSTGGRYEVTGIFDRI